MKAQPRSGVSPAGVEGPFDARDTTSERPKDLESMITREEELEAQALYKRGWTISAIAAHLGRDRKTIRAF